MLKSIYCPNCKAPVEIDPTQSYMTCTYCGIKSKVELPTEKKALPQIMLNVALTQAQGKLRSIIITSSIIFSIALAGIIMAVVFATRPPSPPSVSVRIDSPRVSVSRGSSSGRAVRSSFQSSRGLAAASNAGEPPQDQALGDKLDVYASCLDRHSSRVNQSYHRYLSWIASAETGPTCKESYISYGVYTIYDIDDCEKKVAEVQDKEPKNPALDQAAKAFVAALKTLEPLLKKADRYFEQKYYEDDNCAGAQQRHPQLMAAWKKFQSAEKIIQKTLDAQLPELLRRRVERLGKQAKDMRYYYFKSLLAGMDFFSLARKVHERQANPEELKTATDVYRQELDQLEALAEKNKESAQSIFWFSAYQNKAARFLKAARTYGKQAISGNDQPTADRPARGRFRRRWREPSNPFAVLRQAYNELLSSASSIHFVHYR